MSQKSESCSKDFIKFEVSDGFLQRSAPRHNFDVLIDN